MINGIASKTSLNLHLNKEVRDRLKEVEPPPVEHYVDNDVVYKIKEMGQGRPPRVIKKPLVSEKEIKKQHRDRVNKMREVYGINKNIKKTNSDQAIGRQEIQMSESQHPANNNRAPFEYKESSNENTDNSNDGSSKNILSPRVILTDPKIEEKPKQANSTGGKSLYNFYQNIIDKNNLDE